MEALRSPALRPGDRVAVVSPASPARPDWVARGLALLESWGLRPELAPHALDRHGYLAGTDADRAADLAAALANPRVRAVVVTRGGYGCQRILDRVDLAVVRRDPKPVVGFSDLTALHLALWRVARLACLYGPGAAWRPERTGEVSAGSLRRALMTTDPVVVEADPAASTAALTTPAPSPAFSAEPGLPARPDAPVSGKVRGRLLGGNLCLLASTLGTPDFPELTGAILLLEDVDEPPYKVDRMLTQLHRAGALAGVAGIAVGQFTNCTDDRWDTDVVEVLDQHLTRLEVPVLGGLPIGHGPDPVTVPVGVPATLDPAAATLTVEPAVHRSRK